MKHSQYLVRPDDFHIFEIDPENGCYRSYSTRQVTRRDGTRPNAQDHFTFDSLTKNWNFIPIDINELEYYENIHDGYMEFLKWQSRSDGHGGIKGGTREEYLKYKESCNAVKKHIFSTD